MSLTRMIYYCGLIGGWAAFLAWLVAEILFLDRAEMSGTAKTTLAGGMVGAAIGAGLNLVAGMSNALWRRQFHRAIPGLLCGGVGGAIGAFCGELLYDQLEFSMARAFGWIILGMGIGVAEGLFEGSTRKTRNGFIGGTLGGLIGGLLFDPIAFSGSGMASRATSLVILGGSVGTMIGLAQVVLKEAWLTVVDGFRPGRQWILGQRVTMLGRGDHLPLPLLGQATSQVESEHAEIVRQIDGSYKIRDRDTRIGTLVNGQRIEGSVALHDGDLIKLGTSIVRFNHRSREARNEQPVASRTGQNGGKITAPPPPPGGMAPRPEGGIKRVPPPLPSGPTVEMPSPQPPPPGNVPRIPPPPPPPM